MREQEERLQAQLERLEAGAPLEECLASLPAEEAELLRLAATMRQVSCPARDGSVVAAQRTQLLQQVKKEEKMGAGLSRRARALWQSVRSWLRVRPLPGLSWATVVAIVLVLVTVGVVVGAVLGSRGARADSTAALQELRGLVQVQARDGTWKPAQAGDRVAVGQRVRTGELSRARLVFAEGSQVSLEGGTEVVVDRLEVRAAGERRVIVLTQQSGRTDHQVATSGNPDSRYVVRTSSGSGEAQGTAFQVTVSPERFTRFDVDSGAVAVSNRDSTVVVVAGQSTQVGVDEAPPTPVFRITGEGEVTQIGDTWTIAAQAFQVTTATVIIGDPQVGDWVSVQGRLFPDNTRLADLIVLLHRWPANRFTLTGHVEAIGDTAWAVAGQTISVTAETVVDEGIVVTDLVRVAGVILPGGKLVAESIHLADEEPGWPFDFVGVVQAIGADAWTVSGVSIAVDASTVIDPGLVVGDLVRVEGWVRQDGVWLAHSIVHVDDEEREFQFAGHVDSIAPWVVAGIGFETRDWTRVEPGIKVGDLVRVEGQILEDGTWVASEIERVEDEEPGTWLVLVGTVTGIDPWSVSGIPFVVDAETVIDGDIVVGDLVQVVLLIQPDGTWLAKSIALIDFDFGREGCWAISTIVEEIGDGWIQLSGLERIERGNLYVEGDLELHSIVLVLVCFDHEGNLFVMAIIVIHEPWEGIIIPRPIQPPEEGEDKVTVCHKPDGKNPHSITISRSALPAHLGHGDTLGPCGGEDHHGDEDEDDD